MRTVADWFDLVLRDFQGTPVEQATVRVIDFDPAHLDELSDTLPDAVEWLTPHDPTERRLLLKIDGNVISLDDLPGPEAIAVEIASTLQDHVMDHLNTTWPGVTAPDGKFAVLEPRLGPDGQPQWAAHGLTFDFGDLHRHVPAEG